MSIIRRKEAKEVNNCQFKKKTEKVTKEPLWPLPLGRKSDRSKKTEKSNTHYTTTEDKAEKVPKLF